MYRHCFMICAYQESPYLERCIRSLIAQKEKTEIFMCTSTPNDHQRGLAEKYHIPLIVNPGGGDIQIDWNFAYRSCDAQYVTLVHQDDIYSKSYTACLFQAIEKYDDIAIFYTNYRSLLTSEDKECAKKDINCRLRNLLCFPMRFPFLQKSQGWKKLTLRFGNSICCSSVTYNKTVLGDYDVFKSEMRFCLDWDTYWDLAHMPGRFCYYKKVLTYFRIHLQSTSMLCIENHLREKEDLMMFQKIWPGPIAKGISRVYKLAYRNYQSLKIEES